MPEANVISLCPEDFVQGGLLQDVDVEVKGAVFEVFDYGGRTTMRAEAPLALKMTMVPVGSQEEHEEYVSAGSSRDFLPNPDTSGDTVMSAGTSSQLRLGSNYALFSGSLIAAGFPKAVLREGKAHSLVGLVFHMERRARPKMAGIDTPEDKREKQYIHCAKIIRLPGETGKGAAAARPGAKAGVKADLDAEGLATLAVEKAVDTLNANGKSLAMNKLKILLVPGLKELSAAQKQEVNKMLGDPAWLTEKGFTVDGATVSI